MPFSLRGIFNSPSPTNTLIRARDLMQSVDTKLMGGDEVILKSFVVGG